MLLESKAAFRLDKRSLLHLLTADGRPTGIFHLPEGLFHEFCSNEEFHIRLLKRVHLRFDNRSKMGHYQLTDTSQKRVLCSGGSSSVFTRSWNLQLSIGSASLESAGAFETGYHLMYQGKLLAVIDKSGLCENDWKVTCVDKLPRTDAVFVGLLYETLRNRRGRTAT